MYQLLDPKYPFKPQLMIIEQDRVNMSPMTAGAVLGLLKETKRGTLCGHSKGASLSGSGVPFCEHVAASRLAGWSSTGLHFSVPQWWVPSLLQPSVSFSTISGTYFVDGVWHVGALLWALPLVGCSPFKLLCHWQAAQTCGSHLSPMKCESNFGTRESLSSFLL